MSPKTPHLVGVLAGLLLISLPSPAQRAADEALTDRSVVRILNHSQRPDWYSPWNPGAVQRSTGTGFVIEGGLVMTNAHVVSDTRLLYIFLLDDPTPHQARVLVVGHDCDLALIAPVDEELLDDVPALSFGGLPGFRTTVETYGYPAGGERISTTRGVISRIEMQPYSHSGIDSHLTVQTDAAINPGNSGGPVIQDGRVVGVAFQGVSQLENTGFFIPTEVVSHFLADAADGVYDGYPDLGVLTSGMENPAARARAGLGDEMSGVRVDAIFAGGTADGPLKVGDVLLKIEGRPIANDGSIAIDGFRADFGLLGDRRQIGEELHLEVMRDGTPREVTVEMKRFPRGQLLANAYDRLPRYFIYGGLVFMPLDQPLLSTFGKDAALEPGLIRELYLSPLIDPQQGGREAVVLVRRLDDPVNANLAFFKNQLVKKVNGEEISGLDDLIDAVESNESRFQVFEFAQGEILAVLDREQAERAGPRILQTYGIDEDRRR